MLRRPPRRSLRPHHRAVPVARQLQHLQAAVVAVTHPAAGSVDLVALLPRVWRAARDRAWTVAWLRDQGLVAPDDTRHVGQALAALCAAGGHFGEFEVRRLGTDASGRVWQLRARW